MAKTSNFMLGLFVTIGVFLAAAAILWWGASKYFQKGVPFVTYFDESVQGLQVDSSVKYRGVDVGRVEQIRVAPDNKLIAVVMKIELQGDVERDTVAQLKAAGITGIVFVDLDRRSAEEADHSPKLSFPPPYPVIPSRPSQIAQILTSIDAIMDKVKGIDLQAISGKVEKEVRDLSSQIQQTAKSVDHFFQGPTTQGILKNVESATRRADESLLRLEKTLAEGNLERILARTESAANQMDRTMARVDKALAEGNVEAALQEGQGVLQEGRGVLQEARHVLSALKEEIRSMKLGETTLPIKELAENLDRRTRTIGNEIRALSKNLQVASEKLEIILENAANRPADFIFSGPPPLRREE
jgi:phospholipid/cholesterol/gamma-HCH transport system substrate-binding protein